MFLLLIYLGGLNLEYRELASSLSFPMFPKLVAEAATPYDIEEPALRVAVTGDAKAPTIPEPSPLRKPLAPSSFVP